MSSKFSVIDIIQNHLRTLVNYDNGKYSKTDFFISFFIPFIIAATLIFYGQLLNVRIVSDLLTAFSVFAALLLNLLFVIYTAKTRESSKGGERIDSLKIKLLNQTYNNIQFGILLSILEIIFLILFLFLPYNSAIITGLSFLSLYIMFAFIAVLFMVLKRTSSIMNKE